MWPLLTCQVLFTHQCMRRGRKLKEKDNFSGNAGLKKWPSGNWDIMSALSWANENYNGKEE